MGNYTDITRHLCFCILHVTFLSWPLLLNLDWFDAFLPGGDEVVQVRQLDDPAEGHDHARGQERFTFDLH